jgi:hypothetical protein
MPESAISIREYSRRVGVSDTAVHKAIRAGKISPDAITIHPGNGRRMIYESIASRDWKAHIESSGIESPASPGVKSSPSTTENRPAPIRESFTPPDGTLQAARKAKAVYDAKLAELKYKQQSGSLVPKDQVYSELFSKGQEIREALLAIPDRVIDQLRAAKSRAGAHKILTEAIHEELTRLGKTDQP